jgi:outer membrane lipoprotein-sorting protein
LENYMAMRYSGTVSKLLVLGVAVSMGASTSGALGAEVVRSLSMTMRGAMQAPKGRENQLPPGMASFSLKVLAKGRKVSMDMPNSQGRGRLIYDGATAVVYDSGNKATLPATVDQAKSLLGPLSAFLGPGGSLAPAEAKRNLGVMLRDSKKVGQGAANGHKATIYLLKRTPGVNAPVPPHQTAKLWVAEDLPLPLPLRMEVRNQDGSGLVADFVDIRLNPTLSDASLGVPKGTKKLSPLGPGGRPMKVR